MPSSRPTPWVGIAVAAILAALAVGLRLTIDRPLDGPVGLAWPPPELMGFRRTAVLAGSSIGISLAVAGVMLQALLRNPLASPFTLGLSSGAGVGVMAATFAGHAAGVVLVPSALHFLPATAGALVTMGTVYLLGVRGRQLDPLSLVLGGVVISALCGAIIMLLQHLVPHGLREDLLVWMMGQVPEQASSTALAIVTAIAVGGSLLAVRLSPAMDVATFGDDEAETIGLNLARLRLSLFVLSGVLTANAVALAGPIAFVGLICPHAARLLVGSRHRSVTIAAALLGIALVVGADVARQMLNFGGGRMPVGIFTAMLGGPAFLWLLRRGKGQP